MGARKRKPSGRLPMSPGGIRRAGKLIHTSQVGRQLNKSKKGEQLMAQEQRPLVDRVGAFIEQGQQRPPEQARTLSKNMLEAIGLKVGEHLQDYIAGNAPESEKDVTYWKDRYWSENKYLDAIEAMEPDAGHILQSVGATREEIQALVGW